MDFILYKIGIGIYVFIFFIAMLYSFNKEHPLSSLIGLFILNIIILAVIGLLIYQIEKESLTDNNQEVVTTPTPNNDTSGGNEYEYIVYEEDVCDTSTTPIPNCSVSTTPLPYCSGTTTPMPNSKLKYKSTF